MSRKPQLTQLEEDRYSSYRTDFPSSKLTGGILHNLTKDASDGEEDESLLRSKPGKTNLRSTGEAQVNMELDTSKKIKSILKSRYMRPNNHIIPSEKMCMLLGGETAKNSQRKKSMFNQTHMDTSPCNKKKNLKKNLNSKVKHKNTNRSHSLSEEEENLGVLGKREVKTKLSKLAEIENKANKRRSQSLPRSSSKRKSRPRKKSKAKKQVKPKSKTKRGNRRRSRSIEKKGYKVAKPESPIIIEGKPKTGIYKKLKEADETDNPIIIQMNGSELPWNQITNLFDLLKENLNVQKEIKEKKQKHIGNKTVAKDILQAVKSIGTRGFFMKIIAYGEENFKEEMVEKIKNELGIIVQEEEVLEPLLPQTEENESVHSKIVQEEEVLEPLLPQTEENESVHSEIVQDTEEVKEIILPQEEIVEEIMELEKRSFEQEEPELMKVVSEEKMAEEVRVEVLPTEEAMEDEVLPTEDLEVLKEQAGEEVSQIEEPVKDTGATGEDFGVVEEDLKKDFGTMDILGEPKRDGFMALEEPRSEENTVEDPKPEESNEEFENRYEEFNQKNEVNEEYPPIAETGQVEEKEDMIPNQEDKVLNQEDKISNQEDKISNMSVEGSDILKIALSDPVVPPKGTSKELNFSKLSNQAVQLNKDDQDLAQLEKDILVVDNQFSEKKHKTHSETVPINQPDVEEGESNKFGLSDFGFEMPPLENSSYEQHSIQNTKDKKQDFSRTQSYTKNDMNEELGLNNQQEPKSSGDQEFAQNADSNCVNDNLKVPESTNINHLSSSPVKPHFL